MSTITSSHGIAAPARGSHDQAATAIAPAYRFAARVLRRAMVRHLKRRSIRELRSLDDRTLTDIGVPEHAIDEVAYELATRRVDAWMCRVTAPAAGRMAA